VESYLNCPYRGWFWGNGYYSSVCLKTGEMCISSSAVFSADCPRKKEEMEKKLKYVNSEI